MIAVACLTHWPIQNGIFLNRFHFYTSRQHSSSDEEDWDTPIDVKLKQSAKRNNLTPQNVKNILQVSKFVIFSRLFQNVMK